MKSYEKKINTKIKEKREIDKKDNVTFRLPASLMDNFRQACKKNEVSMTEVLEEMIQDYLSGK